MTVSTAIIGLGIAGLRHLKAYQDNEQVEVAGVLDLDRTKCQRVQEEHGVNCFSDLDELLSAEIDAVSICVPHAALAPITIACAERGKHILLEKPMATRLVDAEHIIEVCLRKGLILMLGFVHRFRDEVEQAREALRSGSIGTPYFLTDVAAMGGDARAPKWIWDRETAGGGVLLYNGVHSIDRVRWLLSDEITRARAQTARLIHDVSVEDTFVAEVEFAHGARGCLVQSFPPNPYGGHWTTRVYGSEGSLFIETGVGYTAHNASGQKQASAKQNDRFAREIEEFISTILAGRRPAVTGEDGLAALAVVEAIYRSSKSGGAWIDIRGSTRTTEE